jgi:hypothetical protein
MKIKILKANNYNNADRTAVPCAEGDTLETSSAYAKILVNDGLAEYVEVEETPAETPQKSKKVGKKRDPHPQSATKAPNPFVS